MQIEIGFHAWEDLDLEEIARLTWAARRASPFGERASTPDRYRKAIVAGRERFSPSSVITARSGGRLSGWMALITGDPDLYELWRWHPIVEEGEHSDEVAGQLIRACLNRVAADDAHRLEVVFDWSITERAPQVAGYYEKYRAWYDQLGVRQQEEIYFMTCQTADIQVQQPLVLDGGLRLRSYRPSDRKGVHDCYVRAFSEGVDRTFLGKTEDERARLFEGYVDDDSLLASASLVLLDSGRVAGFTIFNSRPGVGDEHLGLMGVHPDYQGRGLGRRLLSASLLEVAREGERTLSLGVDRINEPAVRLYRSLGFTVQRMLVTHSLRR